MLDRALKVIEQCQCQDGGWQYESHSREAGNDLSLAVMQAKALRMRSIAVSKFAHGNRAGDS